jgi:hypothetical protein
VDWLASCIALRVVGVVLIIFLRRWRKKFAQSSSQWEARADTFSSGVGVRNLHNPPANGKQGLIPEEMSQTPLINKKQGNLDKVHTANIIKPT